jgi:glyoxylase-like metal-dependent hydrolase (beta-lactamase superfamily II)
LTAIRQPGKINANTTLIDFGMLGVAGLGALYLIRSEETLLVDCGTRSEGPLIVRILRELNSFPPDNIVLTHAHFDHCQGIHYMRKEAEKERKCINLMASDKTIPLLEDQSWQRVFDPKDHYEDIKDVKSVKEGDVIDLDGLTLRIFDAPGHSKGHIAIFDEKNKNLFVGDSLGLKLGDNAYLPPFMPPFWDTDGFYSSVKKLSHIDYEGICLAHFGFIYGEEAKNIFDEAVATFETVWKIFESAEELGRLDDVDYIVESIKKELNFAFPELRLLKFNLKFLLGLMNLGRRLTGKQPYTVSEVLLRNYAVKWLVKGYKTYKNI